MHIMMANNNPNITLNEEQKLAKELIYNNDISFIFGQAGTGKTLLALSVALQYYNKKQYQDIIIIRPTVEISSQGFLPGSLGEKMAPWTEPIQKLLYQIHHPDFIDRIIEKKHIQFHPLTYLQGNTFLNSIIIVDEIQNLTPEQFRMVLGRFGLGSKLILCGDKDQVMLRYKKDSCLESINRIKDIKGIITIHLTTNHRHPILNDIFKAI